MILKKISTIMFSVRKRMKNFGKIRKYEQQSKVLQIPQSNGWNSPLLLFNKQKKIYFLKASFQITCEEWIVNPSKIKLNSKKKATKGIKQYFFRESNTD